MSNLAIKQSVAIILAVITVFITRLSFLSSYSSYLLAFLIIFSIIYITLTKRSKSPAQLFSGQPLELYGITAVIVLIVAITNSLASPLFFFLYFLLFLFAFMGEAISIWIFLISILIFFLPEASINFDTNTIIKLGSLLLITPISYFVAKELERRQLLNQQIEEKTNEIIHDAQVLKDTNPNSNTEENEVIDEIIEEAESLKKDKES